VFSVTLILAHVHTLFPFASYQSILTTLQSESLAFEFNVNDVHTSTEVELAEIFILGA
jgi:hypothetical protein